MTSQAFHWIHASRLADRIRREYRNDGFLAVLIEGKQRSGKSSKSLQIGAETFGKWSYTPTSAECVLPDFEAVKPWMWHRPVDMLKIVFNLTEKQPLGISDDLGVWAYALDWYDPWVKSLGKYLQVAGRQFACLIMTTPSQRLISNKLLQALPELWIGRIRREADFADTPISRKRLCKLYERWDYPDGRYGGVRTKWTERFNATLPDSLYSWYKPISDKYTQIAIDIMKKNLLRMQDKLDKKEEQEMMEEVYQNVGDGSNMKELEEVIGQLEEGKIGGEPQPSLSS